MGSLDSGDFPDATAGRLHYPLDADEFRLHGHKVVDFIADYYKDISKYPVRSQVEPGYLRKLLPESAPNSPESVEDILGDVTRCIIPGLTHWMSPNYYAYFPASGSTAALLGDMLSGAFNVVGFNWMSSPAATELESIVMDWLAKLLRLPAEFMFSGGGGGVLQGTTCEAILCTLAAARDRALGNGCDISQLVVYASDQTHCALKKAAQIAGIPSSNFRVLKTTLADNFSLTASSLRLAVSSDLSAGLTPLYLCATVGTTSSTAVDRLPDLAQLTSRHHIWLHIDAAFAGAACICPEFRHFIDGVELADSFSFNAHKWFFNNLDCCCLWVRTPAALFKSLSTNPEYLKNKATDSKQVVDYKDWQIALSRRFRSLKMWMVLRGYGTANLRKFLRGHVRMAKVFEALVRLDRRFEVVVPRFFSMVCFRVRTGEEEEEEDEGTGNELNRRVLESVNAEGKIYMTHAVIGGVYVMRFAAGGTLTEERHVREAWVVVKEHVEKVMDGGD